MCVFVFVFCVNARIPAYLEGLEVVTDDPELLLELHDLGLTGLGSLLSSLKLGLNLKIEK